MTTQATSNKPSSGYLRQAQLIPHLLPFSKSTLIRKVKDGSFPAPVKLSTRITAWKISDIENWMANRK